LEERYSSIATTLALMTQSEIDGTSPLLSRLGPGVIQWNFAAWISTALQGLTGTLIGLMDVRFPSQWPWSPSRSGDLLSNVWAWSSDSRWVSECGARAR